VALLRKALSGPPSSRCLEDVAGLTLLEQCCRALDRAEELAERVVADGAVVRTATGLKMHPAAKEEMAARAFHCRTLGKLGIGYEPLRDRPGRQPNRG
jgi:hypothetical protein